MTIQELTSLPPEEIAKLSNEQLKTILAPYFTITRQALLPPDKPTKRGLDVKLVEQFMRNNADKIAQIKEARNK